MTSNFVLAADEVWRLQGGRDVSTYRAAGGDDPECICFQEMAANGHYGPGPDTKQGIYVCTPSGEFLASINSASPKSVKKMLERGLDAWHKLPEKERQAKPPGAEPKHRWEFCYPKDGLVLKETFRYFLDDAQEEEKRFNFDFAWFSADEAKSFISQSSKTGEKYKVAQTLCRRLARHHLLDSAQGENGPYHADEVSGELFVEVISIDEQKVRIRINGTSQAIAQTEHDASWRAPRIDAELLGVATFNRTTQEFDEFELVALGKIFSKAKKGDPKVAKSIGWYFTLADSNRPAARLSPTHLEAYDAKWVKKPSFALHDLPTSGSDDQ